MSGSVRVPDLSQLELQDPEGMFRALVQNSLDVMAVFDADAICRYVSPRVEELTGFSPAEIVGRSGFDFIHPADGGTIAESLTKIMGEADSTLLVEARIRTKWGTWIWIEIRGANRVSDPSIQGIVLNYHEITERKDAEERSTEDLRRFDEVQALTHIGSFDMDLATGVLEWSDEQFRIFGYEPGSIAPTLDLLMSRIHPGDREEFRADVDSALSGDVAMSSQRRLLDPDGRTRWVNVCAAKATTEDGKTARIVGTCQDITTMKESEVARDLSRRRQEEGAERLRLLLDSTGEGIFGVDHDGLCTFINRAAADHFGAPVSDFIGQPMHALTHHTRADGSPYHIVDCSICSIYRAFRTDESYSIGDEIMWRADGTSFPVEYSAHPVRSPDGSRGAVINFRDVSNRKKMERTLRSSEALFRGAFIGARTGIALIDAQGRGYVDVNDAMCEMVGYSRSELMALTWMDITHPDDLETNVDLVEHMIQDGPPVNHVKKRYVRKDGRHIFVEIVDSLVRDESGALQYFVTHVQDVTERHKSTQALKESEGLLNAVINNSPTLIYIKDLEGRYVLVNDRMLRAYGRTREEMIGRSPSELYPEDVARRLSAVDDQVFRSREPVEAEERALDANGDERTYLSEKFPLFDDSGQCYALCGISTDITERTRSALEKEQLQGQLRQSLKMEAVGQFAGGIAHDFNNILAVVINYADFLASDFDEGDPRLADVLEIAGAGERAAQLVHQLLTFSRKDVIAPQVVDLNEVIADLHQLLQTLLGDDIELRFDAHNELPPTLADVGQIEQVLINLAVNARDAMPGGGSLWLSTAMGSASVSARSGMPEGECVVLKVEDTGSGMDQSTIDRVFEPFFTTKQRGQGTGLGLATVYGIVKQAGGEIYAESSPGKGACFSVVLPLAPSSPMEASPPVISQLGAPHREMNSRTVLLVEDEASVRALVLRLLRNEGFAVVAFSGGLEALNYCGTHIDEIDVLLTDVIMPGMSGKDLSDSLHEMRGDLKTLYMSGYTDEIIGRRGMLGGDEQLIQKPFKGDEVGSRIRALLDAEVSG